MAQRSEEIKIGSLVVLSVLLFLGTLIVVGGVNLLRRKQVNYVTYFKFAGGLDPGSVVRFAGRKVGTVQSAEFDPQDTTRIIVRLKVLANTPVRTDSTTMISSLGFLGDNYVEISAGSKNAPRLPPGSEIPAKEVVQVADVINNANALVLNANQLIGTLGGKLGTTVDNANQLVLNLKEMTGPQAQQHFDRILANVDEMLVETRPPLRRTLANLDQATAKVGPAIDKADVTLDSATTLTKNLNQVVVENRAEIHQVLLTLRAALVDARRLVGDLDDTVQGNRENLDETLENIRATTQNLKQFSDTIKQRPNSLVFAKEKKDPVPPVGK
jgi:phospholipid/cholesterol/gamma-HCH transport system substrate-binding protein